ncbi:MAG: Ig-like domain-containing protein [Oscillatoriaceae cyanobacterium Prado104]|jgi:hypothetical protein|nr:Ig-like domain-containing protein [Oscillatoriaceae cyanobacterium Prado104]
MGQIIINEFRRNGQFQSNEYVELLLTEDLTASQLQSFFVGDSSGALTKKNSAYQFTNMASIASVFKAGTIIAIGGSDVFSTNDVAYNPVPDGNDADWNIQLLINNGTGGTYLNNVLVGSNPLGGDFAASDVVWVDTSSTGTTSVDSIGWPTNVSGAFGFESKVKIAAPNNGANVEFPSAIGGLNRTANYSVNSAGSIGLPNGGINTIYINSLRNPQVNSAPIVDANVDISSLFAPISINEDSLAVNNGGFPFQVYLSELAADINGYPYGIAVTETDTTNGTWKFSTNGGNTWTDFGTVSDSSATVLGPTVFYNNLAGNTPSSQGWLDLTNLNAVSPTTTASEIYSGKGANLNSTAANSIYAGYSNHTALGTLVNPSFPVLDRNAGSTSLGFNISFSLQIISESRSNQNEAGFSIVVVTSDRKAIELGFQQLSATTGNIFAKGDGITPNPGGQTNGLFLPAENISYDINRATIYTLTIEGDNYSLFSEVNDGSPMFGGASVLSGPLRDYSAFTGAIDPYETPNFLFLGDNSTSAQANINLSQVYLEMRMLPRVRFVPNPDYYSTLGSEPTITFRAWDGSNGVASGTGGVDASITGGTTPFSTNAITSTFTVNPVNDAPSFIKGSDVTLNRNSGAQTFPGWATAISPGPANESTQIISFQVVGNDNGALFSVSPAIDPSGQLTFTPAAGVTGTANITLNLTDNGGTANGGVDTSANQTFVINITNNPPIGNPDTYNIRPNTVLNVPVADGILTNDSDSDGDSLTANLLTNPSSGTLSFNNDGSFTYTPNPGFIGTDSFTYSVSDGVATAPTTVNINVTNNIPIVLNDSYNIIHDRVLNVPAVGVLANDSDSDRDLLTANLVTNPNNGSIALNSDGAFSYTPNPGFVGQDSFTYNASDGVETASGIVNIDVTNIPPIALIDTYNTLHSRVLNVPVAGGVLANDSDLDSDVLTANLVANPNNGSIALNNDGSFSYTPNPGFAGLDSFTYSISDGIATAQTIASINVTNSLPIALIDDYNTPEGQTLNVPVATGVLANDSDLDGDLLTANIVTNPTNGTLNFNSDGSFSYTPNPGFSGLDSFTYSAGDGAESTQSTANINVIKAGTFNFSATNYRVDENGGLATITVTRADSASEAAVSYSTIDGTANAGSDYNSTSGTLNFGIGENSQTFAVQIIDNSEIEGDETVNLSFNNPTNGFDLGAVSSAVLTIVDTTPTPTPEPTPTPRPSETPTPTPSGTPTPTPSGTPTPTPSGTSTPTPSGSPSPTPSGSQSPTPSGSQSPTPAGSPSPTPSGTPSPTPAGSPSPTPSGTPSPTPAGSPSPTPSGSPTPSPTPSGSPSPTPSGSPNPTPSGSPSPTPSESPNPTPSGSPSPTPSESPNPTPSGSPSPTPSGSPSPTPSGTPAGAGTGAPPLPIAGETPTGTTSDPVGETPTNLPISAAEDCICDRLNLPDRASIINPNIAENTLTGTDGKDTIIGSNTNNNINGLNGSDLLIGLFGSDNIYGGIASSVSIGSDADSDTIFGNENNDYILGHAGNDVIYAGKDDDRAIAGKDNDLIWGDKGSDTLLGDEGDDSLFGGNSDPAEGDFTGKDLLFGDNGNDVLYGEESEDTLIGGEDNDLVHGGKDSDLICGDAGSDLLFGDLGSDTLYGGKGDDSLTGGIGDDWLAGDGGNNTLQGGSGRDYFVLNAGEDIDIIADFIKGEDVLVLTGGLTFDRLRIVQENSATLIGIAGTNRVLAVLNGVEVRAIEQQDFTAI